MLVRRDSSIRGCGATTLVLAAALSEPMAKHEKSHDARHEQQREGDDDPRWGGPSTSGEAFGRSHNLSDERVGERGKHCGLRRAS